MPDDEKSDPIEDVRAGLGLLFRAARTTLQKLPKKDFEDAVVTGAREVGRAIENVGRTIERDVFGGGTKGAPKDAPPETGARVDTGPRVETPDEPKKADEPEPPKPG